MKMPHDATHISQLDLSDSDREDANHGKQLTICWMVHCVHDHALCQTQYYCFIWWCLRCLDTFAQAFNSMVFKTHVNDITPTSMKSLAKIDPHDEKSLMTPHWHCKTERYGWWTRSTRGGTPTLRRNRSVQLVGLLSFCGHVIEFTFDTLGVQNKDNTQGKDCCCAMVRPWLGGIMHEPICIGHS